MSPAELNGLAIALGILVIWWATSTGTDDGK